MKAELLARLKSVVPEAFPDGQLDLERLAELAGDAVAPSGPERYGLTWPGKREAIAMLQAPSRATLIPERDASVNFDEARHVFIEGENLEVLKLLYKSYFGRVKLIYIDPPLQYRQRFHLSRRLFGSAYGLSSPDRPNDRGWRYDDNRA